MLYIVSTTPTFSFFH